MDYSIEVVGEQMHETQQSLDGMTINSNYKCKTFIYLLLELFFTKCNELSNILGFGNFSLMCFSLLVSIFFIV
jgi:hypothetical protein